MKSLLSSSISSPKETPYLSDEDPETNELVNDMKQGTSNILVAIRCRPLTKKEKEVDDYKTVNILDDKVVVIVDPAAKANKRTKEQKYAFDYAFGENTGQQEVFNKTTFFLMDGVLNGYNATVFAYGPTGAGKTYTMLGEVDTLGIMLMSFIELFSRIEKLSKERSYNVKISYLEIYNEIVRDLLNSTPMFLDIREDPDKGIMVSGLKELNATSPEEVIECLRLGNKRRTCEPTEANMTSSRSHAILQIIVEYKDRATGTNAEIVSGKLSLIDLAGSERASNTKNRGIRLIEGANINKSLLALGNCINALYEANLKGIKTYIPYRDSKLTRLLKDSLGGNCRTVMIVCISPYFAVYEDTHNTLKYANRAKNIKTTTERNVVNVSYHISKYTNIINDLKNEVNHLRSLIKNKNTPKIEDQGFSLYQKELEDHFNKENKVKVLYFETLNSIDDLSIMILTKENELNNAKYHGDDFSLVKSLQDQVDKLKNTLPELEEKRIKYERQIENFFNFRKEFENKWNDFPEVPAANLRILMQQNIIKINELDQKRRKTHEDKILRHKDLHIQILQQQLRDNLEFLEGQQHKKQKNNENNPEPKVYNKNIRMDDKISSKKLKVFNYRLQGGKYSDVHLKSESILPPISPKFSNVMGTESKIPKYRSKYREDSDSTSSYSEINLIHPKSNKNILKNKFSKKKKINFVSNSEPESNRYADLPKISDKFKFSPYVKKKEENKRNHYSKPKVVNYGVKIRGIEKL